MKSYRRWEIKNEYFYRIIHFRPLCELVNNYDSVAIDLLNFATDGGIESFLKHFLAQ